MLVARDANNNDVLAWRATEECFCPECAEPVFVKDGTIKVTHFSHYPRSTCSYGAGESARHQLMKSRVLEACSKWPEVKLERSVIEGRRADVVLSGAKTVVECQSSAISVDEWTERSMDYSDNGWSVLWVWDVQRCKLDAWPKEMVLCHRLSYGQLTVVDPETDNWFSLHLPWTDEEGRVRYRSRFRPGIKKILETATLRRVTNNGFRLSVLADVWWKAA